MSPPPQGTALLHLGYSRKTAGAAGRPAPDAVASAGCPHLLYVPWHLHLARRPGYCPQSEISAAAVAVGSFSRRIWIPGSEIDQRPSRYHNIAWHLWLAQAKHIACVDGSVQLEPSVFRPRSLLFFNVSPVTRSNFSLRIVNQIEQGNRFRGLETHLGRPAPFCTTKHKCSTYIW
jgi:hypothetical protein